MPQIVVPQIAVWALEMATEGIARAYKKGRQGEPSIYACSIRASRKMKRVLIVGKLAGVANLPFRCEIKVDEIGGTGRPASGKVTTTITYPQTAKATPVFPEASGVYFRLYSQPWSPVAYYAFGDKPLSGACLVGFTVPDRRVATL